MLQAGKAEVRSTHPQRLVFFPALIYDRHQCFTAAQLSALTHPRVVGMACPVEADRHDVCRPHVQGSLICRSRHRGRLAALLDRPKGAIVQDLHCQESVEE